MNNQKFITRYCLTIFSLLPISLFALDINKKPHDFINIHNIDSTIQTDMRYASDHNFVGKKINGYTIANTCILTTNTAFALKKVNSKLRKNGLTLKVYDCYRPQQAVNHFIEWSKNIYDTKTKKEFYPNIPSKESLFNNGYIAKRSGHSRGSTVDITIVPIKTTVPKYNPNIPLQNCTATETKRFADNSLDFGTSYDCLDKASHFDYKDINNQARANRLLLRELMMEAGFKPLYTEWWHFTLLKEKYPNTYFNFPVQ